MNQNSNSLRWKKAVQIVIACILGLDILLFYVNWRAANSAPEAQDLERARLLVKARQYQEDVALGSSIEKKLPQLQHQCDSFYQKDLLSASTGYSVVFADLGQMSRDAGVETSGISFHPKLIKERGLNEVVISASVQGDYAGLIRLLNAMEHSSHFYVLDSLALTSEASGAIKLSLSLRTYLRT